MEIDEHLKYTLYVFRSCPHMMLTLLAFSLIPALVPESQWCLVARQTTFSDEVI
jgi:hypothetical protein